MRRWPLLAAALLLGLAGAARAEASVPNWTPPDAEARYQAQLAKAKAAAPDADWEALRIAAAQRPGFRVLGQSAAGAEMFEALKANDCAKALPAARAAIAESYVDIDAHMIAAFCEENAGDAAAARLDRDIGLGLVKSIETGDGLSPQNAFTPIDVAEEYAVMRALGLTVTEQIFVRQDGHAYDALTAVDAHGHQATYYFLIDRMLAAEAARQKASGAGEAAPR